MPTIFITGGTGYIGKKLIKALLKENYNIIALSRKGSESKIPDGCKIVFGDALNADSYQHLIKPATIFIHLIGVAHPSPSKKEQFKKIDLVSIQQAVKAANRSGISHFVYLSVAQYPTSIMKDYQRVRAEGENLLRRAGIKSSFVRPWYVLGPGHWWPLLLKPLFWIFRFIPSLKEKSEKLDTVTIRQMINTLTYAVKHPPANGLMTYDVAEIKNTRRDS